MELTEDEIIKKYAKHCGDCTRNTLLPYEYEWTCISCGYNVRKQKNELSRSTKKKNKSYQPIKKCRTQRVLYLCSYI